MRRNRLLAAALALVVLAGGLGWFAGSRIASPAEIAARAQPPEPSLITVAVERTVLSADIITRGTIGFDDPVSLSLAGSTGDTESKQVVTSLPDEGTDLGEGDVAVEVAGRPVLMLQGELPAYRDLRPGAVGADVAQLEAALVRLGYLATADEEWSEATGSAVEGLYAAVGYVANSTAADQQESLDAARERVQQATRSVRSIETEGAASGAPTKSALLEARAGVAAAHEAVTLSELQRTTDNAAAARAVVAAQSAVTSQTTAVAAADARLAQARAGTNPDTGEAPTPVELADLDSAAAAARAALTEAGNALADAQAAVTVTARQSDSAVAAAHRSLDIARASLTELEKPAGDTSLADLRAEAAAELAAAKKALAELSAGIGTWLPAGEVVYVARLPVQVAKLETERGKELTAAFMTVSGAETSMTVSLQTADLKRVAVGDAVIIDEPDLPAPLEGTVAAVPEAGTAERVDVEVSLDDIPEQLIGANVRVVIPIESTDGEVLVVPAAALSSLADGDVRVQVEDPDAPGETRFVTVETGLATDGAVEVTPVEGELAEGDRVVVGLDGLDELDGLDGSADPSSPPSADG